MDDATQASASDWSATGPAAPRRPRFVARGHRRTRDSACEIGHKGVERRMCVRRASADEWPALMTRASLEVSDIADTFAIILTYAWQPSEALGAIETAVAAGIP